MKKILSLVLALVLCVAAIPVTAFADSASTDGLFGVIVDADGNIVERLTISRSVFTNKVVTIPAKGSIITYQYEPRNFLFGFSTRDSDGNFITATNTKFRLSLQYSSSIGSNKNEYDYRVYNVDSSQDTGIPIFHDVKEYDAPYWNGEIENNSSIAADVRLIVIINTDDYLADVEKYF